MAPELTRYDVRDIARRRQWPLTSWKDAHARGRLAVPEGAELSPLNLVVVPGDEIDCRERAVIAHARSSQHLYEILFPLTEELAPLDVMCAVDGVLQRFADPVTGTDKGFGAYPTDWAEWILRDSAPGGHRSVERRPWEGSGVEARLYRLEHNIVNYEDHEADTYQFVTADELAAWLKRALGDHNAPISVHLLDGASLSLSAAQEPMIQRHHFDRSDGPEVKAGYQPNVFKPEVGTKNWWNQGLRAYTRLPSLQTSMDGQSLEAFRAENCLDFADLEPHLLPAGAQVNAGSWFVVRLGDTATCIAFPAAHTILSVTTDHDGAAARIGTQEYFSWVDERARLNDYERQWGRWLDGNEPLTKDEIDDGLRALGQLIEGSGA